MFFIIQYQPSNMHIDHTSIAIWLAVHKFNFFLDQQQKHKESSICLPQSENSYLRLAYPCVNWVIIDNHSSGYLGMVVQHCVRAYLGPHCILAC